MNTQRNGQRGERGWTSLLRSSAARVAGSPPPRIERTEPYPGLRPVELERTVATPVPAHVIEAAAAADRAVAGKAKKKLQLHKLLVTAYRTIGFAVLTVIVLGLVSYLGSSLFYYVSSSWVTPAVISPTDDHVLALRGRLAEQASQRDKLVADRALAAASLADVERVIAMNERFGEQFRRAVSADVADRQAQLRKLKALAGAYLEAKHEIGTSNRAYAGMSRARNEQLKHAGMLDQEDYLTGNYQLSQIANANLQLAEKAVDLDGRTVALAREAAALTATLGNGGSGALSYDALHVRQEYERASLELAKANDTRRALAESLAAMDRSIARYDDIIRAIRESPLLVAADGKITVVLVPYDNLGAVKKGGPLYACALNFVACHKVGVVVDVMAGEMEVHHPFHGSRALRGQAVQVQLTDARAAAEPVLFAGRAPLLF